MILTKQASLQNFIQAIETAIQNLDVHQLKPKGLYEPAGYLMNLGGKRIRPALVLAAYSLFKDDFENAVPQALAVELFHNFTLAHDDIMDQAPYRRGKATIHTKWNINTGILSGDLIMIKAYEHLVNCPSEQLPEIVKVFNTTAIRVCEGQQFDMDFETAENVSIEDYINMISLKTAALLDGSLRIGAIRANASDEAVDFIGNFGMNLGIAFQLQDDILDAYGDPEKFGKQVGGDIIANKKTYLLLSALNLAKGETQVKLQDLLKQTSNTKEKVNNVLSIYNQLNIKELALQKMNEYYEASLENLHKIEASEELKEPLFKILASLRLREI